MKKINVSPEACIGCGACVAIDPEHFEFNDEGLSHPISNENLESAELNNAIDSCPTSAISLVENDSCDCEDCNCENCDCDCEECSCCECECENCNCTEDNNCGCHCFEEE